MSRGKNLTPPRSTQISIAEYYIENNREGKNLSLRAVADHFSNNNRTITKHQVQNYVNKYRDGAYNTAAGRRSNKKIAEQAKTIDLTTSDRYEQINKLIDNLLSKIEADFNMDSKVQADLLKDAVNLREKMQRMGLEKHIRRVDSDFLIRLVKYFKPDANELFCIKIVKQIYEEMKYDDD